MHILIEKMIEKIKNPYVIFDKETYEVIYSNNTAKIFIGDENGNIDLNYVFKNNDILAPYIESLKINLEPVQIIDVVVHQVFKNENKVVNVFIGYFDEENSQVFLEIEQQYNFRRTFEALQELSDDILFFVEIEKRSLVLRGELGGKIDIEPRVNNYPMSLVSEGVIHPDDVEYYLKMAQDTLNGITCECEFRVKMFDGSYNWFSKTSIIVHDDDGKPIKVLGKLTNIQDKKDLQYKMTHDLLTNTFNKVSFVNHVKERLSTTSPQTQHAFYFIDIDDFKEINEKHGHTFGDSLIKNLGKILTKCIRGNDFVGRLGVDEFVIFVSNIKSENTILSKSDYIIEKISKEFIFDGKSHNPTISVGIAIYPNHGKTYNELQKKADIALYHSKNNGRNKTTIFHDDFN